MFFARKPAKSTLQQKLDADRARAFPQEPAAPETCEPQAVERKSSLFATRGPDRETPAQGDVLGNWARP